MFSSIMFMMTLRLSLRNSATLGATVIPLVGTQKIPRALVQGRSVLGLLAALAKPAKRHLLRLNAVLGVKVIPLVGTRKIPRTSLRARNVRGQLAALAMLAGNHLRLIL